MMSDRAEVIRVGVCGAAGRMGKEVVKAVMAESDMQLVMAVDIGRTGEDAAAVAGSSIPSGGVLVETDLEVAIQSKKPDVVVDFTSPDAILENVLTVLQGGGRSVIGTTGLSPEGVVRIEKEVAERNLAALIAPNFAIGAVLLMKFAQEASRYFDHAEIIELHHNQKLDAPSGTALRTASLMSKVQPRFGRTNRDESEKETLAGARGGRTEANIRIHSVRLPGLVAHQEVIFGAAGQTLTIRHDSLDRISFMPGVILAIRKITSVRGVVYGLENLM